MPLHNWEITPAELRRLSAALDRIGQRGGLEAALGALAGWALALIDAGAILVALREESEGRLVVRGAAGHRTGRLVGSALEEATTAGGEGRQAWLRVPIVVRTNGTSDEDALAQSLGSGQPLAPSHRERERSREAGAVVARPRRRQVFDTADAELVRLLAAQAALAVQQHETDEQLAALYQQERRRAEQLQAAADVTRTIVRLGRLGDVLAFAASTLKSRFGYDEVAIYLRDDASANFILRAGAGGDGWMGQPLDTSRPRAAAWAARSGEPQVIGDRRELPVGAQRSTALSELAVPITFDRHPIGVLAIASTGVNAFDAGDLALAESIADDLAIAIENLHLAARVRADAAASERARVARELHDETAQQLVAIGRQLELQRMRAGPSDGSATLESIQTMVDQALQNVRRISRNLRPSILEELGLVAAIEALVADNSRSGGPEIRLRVSGHARPLPPTVELALYRITQEALGNSLRHATASHIRIQLSFADEVALEVADDGQGLASPANLAELERGGGMGLVGMRERAREVGGRLEIGGTPGRGTVVRVVVAAKVDEPMT